MTHNSSLMHQGGRLVPVDYRHNIPLKSQLF